MSVKIKVSYETPQELHTVLKTLQPILDTYRVSKGDTGRFKRAYITIKNTCLSE